MSGVTISTIRLRSEYARSWTIHKQNIYTLNLKFLSHITRVVLEMRADSVHNKGTLTPETNAVTILRPNVPSSTFFSQILSNAVWVRDVCIPYHVQNDPGGIQPPTNWAALSSGRRGMVCETDHSPPPTPKVKNPWSYISTNSIHLHSIITHVVTTLLLTTAFFWRISQCSMVEIYQRFRGTSHIYFLPWKQRLRLHYGYYV